MNCPTYGDYADCPRKEDCYAKTDCLAKFLERTQQDGKANIDNAIKDYFAANEVPCGPLPKHYYNRSPLECAVAARRARNKQAKKSRQRAKRK